MADADISARSRQTALAEAILRRTRGNEDSGCAIAALGLFRREAITRPCACMVEPSLVLVAQGAKQMLVGGEAYRYDTEHFLINSVDLPAGSQVITASPEQPCVGLVLRLDLRLLADLIAEGGLRPPAAPPGERALVIGRMTPELLDPLLRLVALLDEPAALPLLAPLVQREIHYRLLMSDQSARLWQIVSQGSQSQRIGKAVDWLKANYARAFRVEDLAARVQMSPSTLHAHFRQITAMSPLQYQKWLRLNEARRLMLNENLDAASAAFQVGYESPSQFSREYSRLFGAPPRRDIDSLRTLASNQAHCAREALRA